MFSGGIWAFHFGYDNNAYPSMERAAQLIQNTGEPLILLCSQPQLRLTQLYRWDVHYSVYQMLATIQLYRDSLCERERVALLC